MSDIPGKLLSECGLVSALLVVAIIWLTVQLAKTRKGWEKDRDEMMDIIQSQNKVYDNLAISYAKIEGILLALRQRR